MKVLRLTYVLALLIAFSACKKDDDEGPTCTRDNWIGTYTGTVDCDGNSEPATVTITASGDNDIVIRYVTGSVTTTFDPLPVTNCMIERTNSAGGVTGSVMTTLDGDKLSLTEILTGGGFNTNCQVEATRD